jgi:predicted GIY-YIG superfamily endonuclease
MMPGNADPGDKQDESTRQHFVEKPWRNRTRCGEFETYTTGSPLSIKMGTSLVRKSVKKYEAPRRDDHAVSEEAPEQGGGWMIYIVECRDGSFYTGITNNLARRLDQHNAGRASRYTRSRRPVQIVYEESCVSRSEALIREGAVKSLSREEKEKLILGRRIDVPFEPID